MKISKYIQKILNATLYSDEASTGLWAIYKGHIYLSTEYPDNYSHVDWFETLGLPTAGNAFDAILRGSFVKYSDKSGTIWWHNGGPRIEREFNSRSYDLVHKIGFDINHVEFEEIPDLNYFDYQKLGSLNWKSLAFEVSKDEVMKAIKDEKWQEFRKSLKGTSTEEKYRQLRKWLRDHNNSSRAKAQVSNYIGALARGGLIPAYRKASLNLKTYAKFDKATVQTSDIPDEVKTLIKDIQKTIPKEDLYDKQNEKGWIENGLQKLMHITILYGIKDKDFDIIEEIYHKDNEIEVSTDRIDYFDNDEFTCAVIRCKSDNLRELHSKLKHKLNVKEDYPTYKPHMAIAYLKPGTRIDESKFKEIIWKAKSIEVSMADGKLKKITADYLQDRRRQYITQLISRGVGSIQWWKMNSLEPTPENYKLQIEKLNDVPGGLLNSKEIDYITSQVFINKTSTMAVPIRESLDYPHSFNKDYKESPEDKKKKEFRYKKALNLKKTSGYYITPQGELMYNYLQGILHNPKTTKNFTIDFNEELNALLNIIKDYPGRTLNEIDEINKRYIGESEISKIREAIPEALKKGFIFNKEDLPKESEMFNLPLNLPEGIAKNLSLKKHSNGEFDLSNIYPKEEVKRENTPNMQYDDRGNLIYIKTNIGNEIWNDYDAQGNLIHKKDSLIGYEVWNEYDDKGKKIHIKYNNGNEEWYEYDDKGNRIYWKNNHGHEQWLHNGEWVSVKPLNWNPNVNMITKHFPMSKKLSLKKISEDINPQGLDHVCAWCQSVYDPLTGMPIRKLTPEEYSQVRSHGICKVCSDEMQRRAIERKEQKKREQGIAKRLSLKATVNPDILISIFEAKASGVNIYNFEEIAEYIHEHTNMQLNRYEWAEILREHVANNRGIIRRSYEGQPKVPYQNYGHESQLEREEPSADMPMGPNQAVEMGAADDVPWGGDKNKMIRKHKPTREQVFPDFNEATGFGGGEAMSTKNNWLLQKLSNIFKIRKLIEDAE